MVRVRDSLLVFFFCEFASGLAALATITPTLIRQIAKLDKETTRYNATLMCGRIR